MVKFKDLNILYQQMFIKIREIYYENEKLREEVVDLRHRVEVKEKNEFKMESKIRALEKVMNNNARTPIKENLKPYNIGSDNEITEKRRNRELDIPPLPTGSSGGGVGGVLTPTNTYRSNRLISNRTTASNLNSNGSSQQLNAQTTSSSSKAFINTNPYSAHLQAQIQQQQHRLHSPIRGFTPPTPRDGLPIANRRAQRRSKSADIWLDHRPPHLIKTDTVFQPKMSRKISVSKIELTDAKKSSKYVLTHQQQDHNGEIVTNLIRGDIIKSPSGGANVLFTDVETLTIKNHEKPKTARKRRSEDVVINDPNEIQERVS